jgi:hypothetical protein
MRLSDYVFHRVKVFAACIFGGLLVCLILLSLIWSEANDAKVRQALKTQDLLLQRLDEVENLARSKATPRIEAQGERVVIYTMPGQLIVEEVKNEVARNGGQQQVKIQ